jgi:hypothetical protein
VPLARNMRVVDVLSASCTTLSWTRANNLSRNAFRGISGTLAEKSPAQLPHLLPHCYSSRNSCTCTGYFIEHVERERIMSDDLLATRRFKALAGEWASEGLLGPREKYATLSCRDASHAGTRCRARKAQRSRESPLSATFDAQST